MVVRVRNKFKDESFIYHDVSQITEGQKDFKLKFKDKGPVEYQKKDYEYTIGDFTDEKSE